MVAKNIVRSTNSHDLMGPAIRVALQRLHLHVQDVQNASMEAALEEMIGQAKSITFYKAPLSTVRPSYTGASSRARHYIQRVGDLLVGFVARRDCCVELHCDAEHALSYVQPHFGFHKVQLRAGEFQYAVRTGRENSNDVGALSLLYYSYTPIVARAYSSEERDIDGDVCAVFALLDTAPRRALARDYMQPTFPIWSDLKKKTTAATIIQRRWRSAVSDPREPICRRRLLREFAEIDAEIS